MDGKKKKALKNFYYMRKQPYVPKLLQFSQN